MAARRPDVKRPCYVLAGQLVRDTPCHGKGWYKKLSHFPSFVPLLDEVIIIQVANCHYQNLYRKEWHKS